MRPPSPISLLRPLSIRTFSSLKRCKKSSASATVAATMPGDTPLSVEKEKFEEEEDDAFDRFERQRSRRERADSVTDAILLERRQHMLRLQSLPVDPKLCAELKALGLGQRRKAGHGKLYERATDSDGGRLQSNIGAGGHALYLGSASRTWPRFKHALPEVAMAGHTNCGKSSLANALAGVEPRKGAAAVSDRAGWTQHVSFFQIGRKPPILVLADLPGYGHAVAAPAARRLWKDMVRSYLAERAALCRCCVLADASRGLCEEDRHLLAFLERSRIEHQVVLTKGDLLSADKLSQCVSLVREDLKEHRSLVPHVAVVSSSTGAGVSALWASLRQRSLEAPGSLLAVHLARMAAVGAAPVPDSTAEAHFRSQ